MVRPRTFLIILAAAFAMAGSASATVMTADFTGITWIAHGPAGWWPEPDHQDINFSGRGVVTTNGIEHVLWNVGGLPVSMSFQFDTDLGVLSQNALSQTLTWTLGQGANPILSGTFSWPFVGVVQDLSTATSVTLQRSQNEFGALVGGPGWLVQMGFILQPWQSGVPGEFHLDQPFSETFAGFPEGGADFGPFGVDSTLILSERLTPSAVPEPQAWALMFLGLGLAGAALRRRRGPACACQA